MANGPIQIAIGALLLVIAAVLVFTVLPIADEAIDDYADGPDDDLNTTADNPSSAVVALADLFSVLVVASLIFGGVAELVVGARQIMDR